MNNHRLLAWLLAATVTGCRFASAEPTAPRIITPEELFEIAETCSPQLRPMLATQEEALKEVSIAQSSRLPDINASLSVSYIGDGFTTRRDFSDYQRAPIPYLGTGLTVSVSQPVYTGGAVTAGISMANEKSTAARYATEMRRDNLRMTLTGFYLDIYKYGNLRTVVENNIAQARKVLCQMQARRSEGMALATDITRYELLISNLELELVKINNLLAIFNNNLVTICGLPDGCTIQPDSTILQRALPRGSEAAWLREADQNSPALALARTEVSMSRLAEKIAKSDRMPKIGLQAGWSIDGPILVEVPPINRNLSYWYAGVGVSYNIASLYKSNRSVAKSRAAVSKAVAELDAAADNLSLDIRADYLHYLEAYEELVSRRKSEELALSNYNVTATRYAAGMALITDMIDAANSKLEAEQQMVNARINIIYYYYKLLFKSGTI